MCKSIFVWLQIPHDRIFVAEVARLRGFGCFGHPEFWQIRLRELHYFFAWGISVVWYQSCRISTFLDLTVLFLPLLHEVLHPLFSGDWRNTVGRRLDSGRTPQPVDLFCTLIGCCVQNRGSEVHKGKSRRCQIMPPAMAAMTSMATNTPMSARGHMGRVKISTSLTYWNSVAGWRNFIRGHQAEMTSTK